MEGIREFPVKVGTRAMHSDLPEEDDDKYWIRITASNAEVDMHHSVMDPATSLPNFERDAKTDPGVALKDHHGWRSFGYGRSADAILTEGHELRIDFFILKNMEYSDYSLQFRSSEQLIRAIEHELVNQASIGFYGAREVCNLCQLPIRRYSYWDWEPLGESERCSHKMGKLYDVGDGRMEAATYTVYDAHLKEVSLVEFGSNRGTSIEKKRAEWLVEQWGKGGGPGSGSSPVAPWQAFTEPLRAEMRDVMEELVMTDQEWITKLRDSLNIPDVRSTDEPDAVLERMETEVAELRKTVETQKDEIAGLQADAADGKAFREARVEEAVKQGIRAYGEDFDEAYHRQYYGDMPIEQLEKHIAHNKEKGDAVLPAGRSTGDKHEPPPERDKIGTRQRQRRNRRR